MGIKKDLKDLRERAMLLHSRVNTLVDATHNLERQLRPPTMADAMALMGRRVGMLGASLSGTTPPPAEPPTVYQMLKALHDKLIDMPVRERPPLELGDVYSYVHALPKQAAMLSDVQGTVAKLLARQHQNAQTSTRTLASIERKLGKEHELDELIKELKAVLPDVTGIANNISKIRATGERPAGNLALTLKELKAQLRVMENVTHNGLNAIEDKLIANRVTEGNGHKLIVERLDELRSELHGLMDEERAERQRLASELYAHIEAPKEADASSNLTTLVAQASELSERVGRRAILERVRAIDTRTRHMADAIDKLTDELAAIREMVKATESFALNTPTAHQMHQLHEYVVAKLDALEPVKVYASRGTTEMLQEVVEGLKDVDARLMGVAREVIPVAQLVPKVGELQEQNNRTHQAVTHIREGLERANMIEP